MASVTGSVGAGCRLRRDRLLSGGGVLHSQSSDSMDCSSASVGLVRDGLDVDGATALEADAVEGCWLPET